MHTKVSILIQFKGIKPIRRFFPLVSKIIFQSAATYRNFLRQTTQNTQASLCRKSFSRYFYFVLVWSFSAKHPKK